jgi:succinate dehydrogenase / fumarate reductase membrane anchor subunit
VRLPGMRFTGLAAWWVQRLSAAYMLAFLIFLLATFALHPVHGYAQWHGWVGRISTEVALATFFAALLSHMWVGLRDVLLDYAKPPALQRLLLVTVGCGLVAIAASVVWILVSASG